jgi:hypothetical protein
LNDGPSEKGTQGEIQYSACMTNKPKQPIFLTDGTPHVKVEISIGLRRLVPSTIICLSQTEGHEYAPGVAGYARHNRNVLKGTGTVVRFG